MPSNSKNAAGASAAGSSSKAHGSSKSKSSGERPGIDIRIANHYSSKMYSSGASVMGEAIIRVQHATHFERLVIQFAGASSTRNYMMPEIDQVVHHFLLLDMPIARKGALPGDRILQAGVSYAVPFHFVIPHSLPIGACRHSCEHPSVREHHLRLPPSVGGWHDRDDSSPETSRVHYCVTVSLLQRPIFSSEPVSILRGRREIRVLPTYAEDAPLDISVHDKRSEYKLSKSKPLRKSLLSRKLGIVAVEAVQPSAVMVAHDGREASPSKLLLNIRFTPTSASLSGSHVEIPDSVSPPTINSITAKLITKTFFNTAHMSAFPDRGLRQELNYSTPLYYAQAAPVHDVEFDSNPDWKMETTMGEGPTCVASVNVEFKLPAGGKKMLLPTFHSCLLSRTYTLRVCISTGPGRTTTSLSVPVQVAVESSTASSSAGQEALSEISHLLDDTINEPTAALPPKYKDHMFGSRYEREELSHYATA